MYVKDPVQHTARHVIPVCEMSGSFSQFNKYAFFFSQDLDGALPIIENYKDRLLAIGEVNLLTDQMTYDLIQTLIYENNRHFSIGDYI